MSNTLIAGIRFSAGLASRRVDLLRVYLLLNGAPADPNGNSLRHQDACLVKYGGAGKMFLAIDVDWPGGYNQRLASLDWMVNTRRHATQ